MRINKSITNLEIAELLRSVAAAYEIKDQKTNRFKIIAYERAADAVEHLSSEAKDLWDEGRLDDVSGIGKSIESHLGEIFKTGQSIHFKDLMKGIDPAVFKLIEISGIGPKTAQKLVTHLNISQNDPVNDLMKKAKNGEISKIEGFGTESEKAIIQSIQELKGRSDRHLLNYAETISNDLIQWLQKSKDVEKTDVLGSLRRKASTVGDIDIAASSKNPQAVIEHFTNYPNSKRTLEKGETSAALLLPGNVQVDLKVQNPDTYGSLLQHFTGSKHHNIALREYAMKKSLSLSEYGIKKVKGQKTKVKSFSTEEGFYKFLGMQWIPPELREDKGEIQSSIKNELPNLVTLIDIKSDLQIHSNFNIETSHDIGQSTMEEIINKADLLGYEYIAFTEHNPSHSQHNKMQVYDLLMRKKENIDKINSSNIILKSKRVKYIFNSLEIDILPDGNLAIDDQSLNLLDFALVSIHSSFRMGKLMMTDRVLNALDHPKVKVFAHPTARKLGEREGIELDWDKIFQFCKERDIWLEINADPMRLDLPDFLVYEAIKNGVKLTIGTDSHFVESMDNLKYGVDVARRGWAEKKDIINCLTLKEFKKMIE